MRLNHHGRLLLGVGATDNTVDLLQVGSNTDISASIGRAKIFSLSDQAFFSHHAMATSTNFALRQYSNGTTYLNSEASRSVVISNGFSSAATFSGSAISLLKPTTITGGSLIVDQETNTAFDGLRTIGTVSERSVNLYADDNAIARLDSGTIGTGLLALNGSGGGNVLIGSLTNNGTDKLQVAGSASNTTGVWAISSDRRVKENIREVSDPLEKALALSDCVKQYNYIEEMDVEQNLRTQYIAQELIENGFSGHVSETVPKNEAVGELLGWEYGDKESVDEDGNVTTERVTIRTGEALLQVENNFAPYAFPAIKALKELLDEANSRIELLETKLDLLS